MSADKSVKWKFLLLLAGAGMLLFLILTGKLLKNGNSKETIHKSAEEKILILGTEDTLNGLEENEVYTNQGVYHMEKTEDINRYLFQCVYAVTEGDEILHITDLAEEAVCMENCMITENDKNTLCIFSEGFVIKIPSSEITQEFSYDIADVSLKSGKVEKISVKNERIQGKILSVHQQEIELEGYGLVPISEEFRFYETYGSMKEGAKEALLVGTDEMELVAAEGMICAAVSKNPLSLPNIRVLLKTTDYKELMHKEISFTVRGAYELCYGTKVMEIHEGETLWFDRDSEELSHGRVILKPLNDNSRIEITSIQRNYGVPSYAGTIEISKESEGLVLVNELDLETYLYSVVPSEMPASYELEALKAQAVCARSYAYRQMYQNAYSAYGAHVDDSVSFQVYNNLPTDEKVIRAVDETKGKVLTFQEEVAVTYYFSTSCGYTTNETIWENGSLENTYLTGKLLNDSAEKLDLQKEENFREFILNDAYETYDSEEAWYRWEITIPLEQLEKNLKELGNVGKVTDLSVIQRNEGGAAQTVLVSGSEGTLEIHYEYAIRSALNGEGGTIYRKHGKEIVAGSMLPSAFFVIDRVEEDGKLIGFQIRGGGFGHGAGMSQNGANHMAELSKTCEEILETFYPGTILTKIQEK